MGLIPARKLHHARCNVVCVTKTVDFYMFYKVHLQVALNTCQPNSRGSMSVLDLGGGWLVALGKLPSSEPPLSVKWEGDPASGCVKVLARSYWWHLEGTR